MCLEKQETDAGSISQEDNTAALRCKMCHPHLYGSISSRPATENNRTNMQRHSHKSCSCNVVCNIKSAQLHTMVNHTINSLNPPPWSYIKLHDVLASQNKTKKENLLVFNRNSIICLKRQKQMETITEKKKKHNWSKHRKQLIWEVWLRKTQYQSYI